MPLLAHPSAFPGRHWETGSVANALSFTSAPLSEALLLGLSGGIAFGYFTFHYAGYAPHVALLTRNTFDPLEALLNRLAIPREVVHTDKPDKAEANLIAALEGGSPVFVWADMYGLPYNAMEYYAGDGVWAMAPVLVYGVENGEAWITDRSAAPLRVPMDVLTAARGRVRKDRYRQMTLSAPELGRMASAVESSIRQCLSLFTDLPPAGSADNFGLKALDAWAGMLTNTRNKRGWARFFPRGEGLYAALAGHPGQPGAYTQIAASPWTLEDGSGAERLRYAAFLDEAANLLDRPGLRDAAACFRASHAAWLELADALLPDGTPLAASKALLAQRTRVFVEQGSAAEPELRQINEQLAGLRAAAATEFPLNEADTHALLNDLADHVRAVRVLEADAVAALKAAMA